MIIGGFLENKSKPWGGSRKGAGRKPKNAKKQKISVTLDQALLKRIDALPEKRSIIIEKAVSAYLSGCHDKIVKKNENSISCQRKEGTNLLDHLEERSADHYAMNITDLWEQSQGKALVDIINEIEPRARLSAPVGIPKLWRKAELSGWSRHDFVATLFRLAKNYQIFLHRHVHEIQATDEEKKAALRGEDGSLFIGIVLNG